MAQKKKIGSSLVKVFVESRAIIFHIASRFGFVPSRLAFPRVTGLLWGPAFFRPRFQSAALEEVTPSRARSRRCFRFDRKVHVYLYIGRSAAAFGAAYMIEMSGFLCAATLPECPHLEDSIGI